MDGAAELVDGCVQRLQQHLETIGGQGVGDR
jgi:hypothetical protein